MNTLQIIYFYIDCIIIHILHFTYTKHYCISVIICCFIDFYKKLYYDIMLHIVGPHRQFE